MARNRMRRHARLVTEEPAKRAGKARLYAYGFRAIAAAAGCYEKTVRNAVQAGKLDPQNLRAVSAFVTHWKDNRERPTPCKPAPAQNDDAAPESAAPDETPAAPPAPPTR